VPAKIALGEELELISYLIGELVRVSQVLQRMLSWRFVRPITED